AGTGQRSARAALRRACAIGPRAERVLVLEQAPEVGGEELCLEASFHGVGVRVDRPEADGTRTVTLVRAERPMRWSAVEWRFAERVYGELLAAGHGASSA
ncbi:MAG TPA: hypothetical protein VI076_01480, partial [Actinopolymorphaceae bacterium]